MHVESDTTSQETDAGRVAGRLLAEWQEAVGQPVDADSLAEAMAQVQSDLAALRQARVAVRREYGPLMDQLARQAMAQFSDLQTPPPLAPGRSPRRGTGTWVIRFGTWLRHLGAWGSLRQSGQGA